MRKYEEDEEFSSSGIFKIRNESEALTKNILRVSTLRRNLEKLTFGRIFEHPSSNKEDEQVYLKDSYKEDDYEVTTLL